MHVERHRRLLREERIGLLVERDRLLDRELIRLTNERVEFLVLPAQRRAGAARTVDKRQPVLRVRIVLEPVPQVEDQLRVAVRAHALELREVDRRRLDRHAQHLLEVLRPEGRLLLRDRGFAVVVQLLDREALATLVARFGKQRLRLLRVVRLLVVGLVAGDALVEEGSGRDADAIEHLVDVLLAVHRERERLANTDIVERLGGVVEREIVGAGTGVAMELLAELRIVLDLRELGRGRTDQVQLALLVGEERGLGAINLLEDQRLDTRRAAEIVVVALEDPLLVLRPFDDLERTVADIVVDVAPPVSAVALDEVLTHRVGHPRRHDVGEVAGGVVKMDLEGQIIDSDDGFVNDGGKLFRGRIFRVGAAPILTPGNGIEDVRIVAVHDRAAGPLDRIGVVMGGYGLAVGVRHAFTKMECVDRTIGRDRDALGRGVSREVFLVQRQQWHEDLRRDLDLVQEGEHLGVRRVDLVAEIERHRRVGVGAFRLASRRIRDLGELELGRLAGNGRCGGRRILRGRDAGHAKELQRDQQDGEDRHRACRFPATKRTTIHERPRHRTSLLVETRYEDSGCPVARHTLSPCPLQGQKDAGSSDYDERDDIATRAHSLHISPNCLVHTVSVIEERCQGRQHRHRGMASATYPTVFMKLPVWS